MSTSSVTVGVAVRCRFGRGSPDTGGGRRLDDVSRLPQGGVQQAQQRRVVVYDQHPPRTTRLDFSRECRCDSATRPKLGKQC